MICHMEKARFSTPTRTFTGETSSRGERKEKGLTTSAKAQFLKALGGTTQRWRAIFLSSTGTPSPALLETTNVSRASINTQTETFTKDSGRLISKTAKASSFSAITNSMRGTSLMAASTALGFTNGQAVTYTLVISSRTSAKAWEFTSGKMVITAVNGKQTA